MRTSSAEFKIDYEMRKVFQVANEAYLKGDPISDHELDVLIKVYENTIKWMSMFDRDFNIVLGALIHRLEQFKRYKWHRKMK